jgi:hypothetical protein
LIVKPRLFAAQMWRWSGFSVFARRPNPFLLIGIQTNPINKTTLDSDS